MINLLGVLLLGVSWLPQSKGVPRPEVPLDPVAALSSVPADGGVARVLLPGVGDVSLTLRPIPVVAPDAVVEVGSMKRSLDEDLTRALHGVAHFEGVVEGIDHSRVFVAVGTTGVAAMIDLGAGVGLFGLRALDDAAAGLCAGPSSFVRIAGAADPEVERCRCLPPAPGDEGGVAGFAAVPPGMRKIVELAVDSDHEFLRIFPSEVAAVEYVAALVGEVSSIYRRDCDAGIILAYLRLQTSPEDLFNEPDPLGPFREHWVAEGGAIDRDLFTLLTGRRNLPYGGVAWLSAACNPDYGYSVNGYLLGRFVAGSRTSPGSWDPNVVAHELGHNLGTWHTHDYGIDGCASGVVQRGTIMSYCHVRSGASANIDLHLHRGTVAPIVQFLAAAECLHSDCDDDALPDAEEIAADPSLDQNADGVLDACQDCNEDGVPDPVQIASGELVDADGDLRPDACEEDCDSDGVPDHDQAQADPTLDRNGDGVLASCEVDCDGDGLADSDEINADMTLDRSRDGRLDACEDCDADGIDDFAALRGSKSRWVGSEADALLRELDPRSGVLRRTVVVGTAPILDLAFGADGRLYAASGARAWAFDPVVDAAASPWGPELEGEVRSVAAAPDGRLAAMLGSGRIVLLSTDGASVEPFASAFAEGDARDLAFRRLADGTHEAFVSTGGGLIHRLAWPQGTRTVFADMQAMAPELRGILPLHDGSILVAASALDAIHRVGATGEWLGRWDVQGSGFAARVQAIAFARDDRSVVATSPVSSASINGYVVATGYVERTLRVYPIDAPRATAIVVAPASETDRNGNLLPDACEGPIADLNGDGEVGGADLGLLLARWGSCDGCGADLDADGLVGGSDLSALLGAWGS